MFACIVNKLQNFIRAFDRDPYCFMQLLAAHGGVPGLEVHAPGTAPSEKIQSGLMAGYRAVHTPDYSFFDLMADKGYTPFAAQPAVVSAHENFMQKAWHAIEDFANDNRVPGTRRRPRAA